MTFTMLMARNVRKCFKFITAPQTIRQMSSKLAEEDLKVTDDCVKRLEAICDKDEFLRLCVESGGCSGYQYKFELDRTIANDDCVLETQGIKIVVDTTSLNYIRGSTIDYEQQLIRAAFRLIRNPKAEDGCSCGASFSIKID
ncbi:iron-sulfur cluster assembly 2 homolog, mitochondrial isoform X1 [Acyrthosiphon pisum]|uniref:Iron-sulfur cluster assembly 2 homolog, mitochondrial n=2 Tax=Acyrthosiphon pisum TaxID=7029 RepID=A0A8R2A4D4_ACYPI|nr:iron-sulfur cluster assembly 2 homolog, mitochondrial isoform X1 [Acyrthosiphon pisum]|eukprot:XP_001943742.1 PREDICTED: iron-sulfur cluster assembly 2 homolog, mitochondrial isoform X1 [Acyrthosiphon pisum]